MAAVATVLVRGRRARARTLQPWVGAPDCPTAAGGATCTVAAGPSCQASQRVTRLGGLVGPGEPRLGCTGRLQPSSRGVRRKGSTGLARPGRQACCLPGGAGAGTSCSWRRLQARSCGSAVAAATGPVAASGRALTGATPARAAQVAEPSAAPGP